MKKTSVLAAVAALLLLTTSVSACDVRLSSYSYGNSYGYSYPSFRSYSYSFPTPEIETVQLSVPVTINVPVTFFRVRYAFQALPPVYDVPPLRPLPAYDMPYAVPDTYAEAPASLIPFGYSPYRTQLLDYGPAIVYSNGYDFRLFDRRRSVFVQVLSSRVGRLNSFTDVNVRSGFSVRERRGLFGGGILRGEGGGGFLGGAVLGGRGDRSAVEVNVRQRQGLRERESTQIRIRER
jgi:hypothetical protein